MAEADIPVDLFNPGQVFACLGFLEAADILLGEAKGGFSWSDVPNARFRLSAEGNQNPYGVVLDFLARADVKRFGPIGYVDPAPKKGKKDLDEQDNDEDEESDIENAGIIDLSETFPMPAGDQMALPIRIHGTNSPIIEIGHWADGSGRENFKLYSGNRSAYKIACDMLKGVRKKPSKKQNQKAQAGEIKTKGLTQLWDENPALLTQEPFHVLTPMGGSFNFDPRGAWTAIDAGYSPNDQKPKHTVEASPVVEFLAAWGVEHARPEALKNREIRYAAWGLKLPPILARIALSGAMGFLPLKYFHFRLDSSGKNKIVTFAEEEIQS